MRTRLPPGRPAPDPEPARPPRSPGSRGPPAGAARPRAGRSARPCRAIRRRGSRNVTTAAGRTRRLTGRVWRRPPTPTRERCPAGCRRARRGIGRAVPDVRAVRRRDGRAAGRGRRRPKDVVIPADRPRQPRQSGPRRPAQAVRILIAGNPAGGPWRRGARLFLHDARGACAATVARQPARARGGGAAFL